MPTRGLVFTESYIGSQDEAWAFFRSAATKYAKQGYSPISQDWVEERPGWGCLTCALIIILFVTVIGILLLPFIFLSKRDGRLVVTYAFTAY